MVPGHHPEMLEKQADLERRPGAFEGAISDGEATEVERKPRAVSSSPRGRMGKRTSSGPRDSSHTRPRSSTVRRLSGSSPEPLPLAEKPQGIQEFRAGADPISRPLPVQVEECVDGGAQ